MGLLPTQGDEKHAIKVCLALYQGTTLVMRPDRQAVRQSVTRTYTLNFLYAGPAGRHERAKMLKLINSNLEHLRETKDLSAAG
jgi:hypothetical protein